MTRFVPVFITSLFLSLHLGTILYVNSSLLNKFFDPSVISFLFILGALGNITLFLSAPKLIEKLGKRVLLLFLLILATISTIGLSLATTKPAVAVFFIIYASLLYMIYYCLDIFLEEISLDAKTGEIRSAHIALVHLGLMLGLSILTLLAVDNALKPVYIAAALLLVPPILFAIFSFKSPTPNWHGLHHRHASLPFRSWWLMKNVRRATLARLSLEFFYTFMTIYTPLYLYSILGFNWTIIGIMFVIMLLPFILIQWPVGKLADYFIGEKEMMIVGFLIMGITLVFMPFLEASAIFWITALFFSRVGAALVEITSDSYFFKHVSPDDTRLLSIFRLTRPASIVLGAGLGALSLFFFSFEKIFFVLAVIIFFGLKESLLLRDTL